MASCLLCLELNEKSLDFIEVTSPQWQELEITEILEKHFWPLRTKQMGGSWLCLTCWKELANFHKFYLRVEEAHRNFLEKDFKEANITFSCLEPEILIEANIQQILEDEQEESCLKAKNKFNLNEISLKNDPLEKLEVIKTRNKKKTKNVSKTEIKLEPEISSHSESEESNDDQAQLHKDLTDDNPKKERLNRKEKDQFISQHFEQMICDVCRDPLENFSSMQKHFSREHDRKGYLLCCNRKFYERNNLVDHLQCHINPDYFKCPQCGKVLSDRKNFKSHLLRVHRPKDVVLKHSCEICGKSFTQAYVLRTHKLTHLPKEEKKFPCTECGKFYGNSYLLKIHTEVVHLKKQAKVCYICGKTLGTSTEYKAHMTKHEGLPAPDINCDVCGLRLISLRSLKLHKESQHPVGGKQDHPCPICHKISPTVRALKKHINTMHEKGCDHKCSMCEKAFRRRETLKEHIASQHTGATLYTCPWCPKTFNSNGNMHAHRKNVHPKECLELKLQRYAKNITSEIS